MIIFKKFKEIIAEAETPKEFIFAILLSLLVGFITVLASTIIVTMSAMAGIDLYIWIMSDTTLALFFKK